MLSKETILSKILNWEDLLPEWHVTWILTQSVEKEIIKSTLSKTVAEFIADFKGLVLELCWFDHERADRPRFFYNCPYFWRNVACGHPRVIRAKFHIAYTLLHRTGAIHELWVEKYLDKVYEYTEPNTRDDFRATHGYWEEFKSGKITWDSPTLQKMQANQATVGKPLLALRDEIALKLEKIFDLN